MSTDHNPDSTAARADCLFCRIAGGDIPSRKVYEDDDVFAFHDVQPKAPIHFLIVPKAHYDNLYDTGLAQQALLGKIFGLCGRLAREQGADDGFRVVVNNGRVGHQEVYHLHIHVLGGAEPLGAAMTRL